jgi:small subunit ribosomal protein S4
MHAWRRGKFSAYGVQLREKQRLKRFYGVMEGQFRRYIEEAQHSKGNTGVTLLVALERRLDNVLCHLGLASSRAQARQMVVHGHIEVNGRKVSVPSAPVSPGDVIAPRRREGTTKLVGLAREATKGRPVPAWLEVTEEPLQGRVLALPTREDISLPIREQLIVEFASK